MLTLPGGPNQIMYFVVFSTKTVFFKFQDIFPECFLHREGYQQIEPLQCLQDDGACHVNHNCMEILSKRVHVLFQEVLPTVEVMILYFRKLNGQQYGAGLFWRDMREPRVITMNASAWTYAKHRGRVYAFSPNSSFFLTGRAAPPEVTTESSGLDQKI